MQKVEDSFSQHHAKIREQMDDEMKEMLDENGKYEIDKETDDMEEKYKELLSEIEEKRKLMADSGVERK
jgi:DNA-directed RNA polymerase subunit N (RpoN/RPB10)